MDDNRPRKLILVNRLSPGDILVMTAAIECLHEAYPGRFLTDVRCSVPEIFENNPYITKIADDDPEAEVIEMHYPLINRCNQIAVHFMAGYVNYLSKRLKLPIPFVSRKPRVYISEEEKGWINQIAHHFTHDRHVPFWLVNAGIKNDFTTKAWPIEYYQEVVDATIGLVQWVQVGSAEHNHPRLHGVIDLIGKTDHRQLIRLAYHAKGGLGPMTYLMHLMAAVERPYICLLGGREPVCWNQYPLQHTLHTMGALPCCETFSCWRSKVMPEGNNMHSVCDRPILGMARPVPQCMAMIRPEEVISIVKRYMVKF